MNLVEGIAAALLAAALLVVANSAASDVSAVFGEIAPDGLPQSACVEAALKRHGVVALDEMNAQLNGTKTAASSDVSACVMPNIPDDIAQALNEIGTAK